MNMIELCRSFLVVGMAADFALAMLNSEEAATLPLNASNCTEVYLTNVTAVTVGDAATGSAALLPIEFVVVLVLAAACVLVGVIYAYVHITRAARARSEKRKRRPSTFGAHHDHHHHHHSSRDASLDEGHRQKTHLMFFRKSTSA